MKSIQWRQLPNQLFELKTRLVGKARQQWIEIVQAEAPATVLAFAFTMGLLISTIPVPVIDMALAGLVLRRFSRLPRAPFVAAMAMTNNLVMAPVYASTPKVGGFALHLLAGRLPIALPDAIALQVLVGYLLIVVGLAVAGYVFAATGFYSYQRIRRVA